MLLDFIKSRVEFRESVKDLNIRCPFCDPEQVRDFHLGIRKADGVWHCFRCGRSGRSLRSLERALGRFSANTTKKLSIIKKNQLSVYDGLSVYSDSTFDKEAIRRLTAFFSSKNYRPEYIPWALETAESLFRIQSIALTPIRLEKFKIFENRLVFWSRDKLWGTGRTLDSASPKFLTAYHPQSKREDRIFEIGSLQSAQRVFATEGPLDAFVFYTLAKKFYPDQTSNIGVVSPGGVGALFKLIESLSKEKTLTLVLDTDLKFSTYKKLLSLKHHFFISLVLFKTRFFQKGKDLQDLTRVELKEAKEVIGKILDLKLSAEVRPISYIKNISAFWKELYEQS